MAIPFCEAVGEFHCWNAGEKIASTAKRTRGSLASATAFFRAEIVSRIDAGHIEDHKTWRRQTCGVKECTLRNDVLNLSLFFQYAKKQHWCEGNPVDDVKKPSAKDAVRMYILSEAEERAYFAAALEQSQDLYDVARLMFLQGCRPDEVMRLQPCPCDLVGGQLKIVKGKSTAAKRALLMHNETRSILARRNQGEWCFPSGRNTGLPIASLTKAHNAAAEAAGMPCVLYDMRHTFATRSAQYIPLPALKEIMGHSHISTTMEYVHINEQGMADAMTDYWRKAAAQFPTPQQSFQLADREESVN